MNPIKLNLIMSLVTLVIASVLLYVSHAGGETTPPIPLIAALAVLGLVSAIAARRKLGQNRNQHVNRPGGKRG